MKSTIYLYSLSALLLLWSCGKKEEAQKEAQTEEFPELYAQATALFAQLPETAENPENPSTEKKIALGKKLYFDNRLSKDNTQSCNTCHDLANYGVDNKAFSEGNDGELGGRNSPTTLNAALHVAQFWDGREPDVEAQAGGPILNPVEMAMPSEEAVIKKLKGIEDYVKLFSETFPEEKEALSYENLKKAIGAFERQLLTPAKFDEYLKGDQSALTAQEKRGLDTFIKVGCTTCHSGSLLGGNNFFKFGLVHNYWEHTKSKNIDQGKFDLTQEESDKAVFKTSSLRNIEKTYPYFHDGSVESLEEATIIMAKTQLGRDLSKEQVDDMVAFMKTLTGELPLELQKED